MYKIIGGDHKEYGPVSADELRRWFREGRLNAQSLIRPENGTEWQPLSSFPEFAPLFTSGSFPSAPPPIGPTTGQFAGTTASPSTPVPVAELEQRDYDIDIFRCVSRAWELLQKKFWPVVGVFVLVSVANWAVSQVLQLLMLPAMSRDLLQSLSDPTTMQEASQQLSLGSLWLISLVVTLSMMIRTVLTGGLLYYYLKLIRNEPAELVDAFAGFTRMPVSLLLLGLLKPLLITFGLFACLVPGIYVAVAWWFSLPLVMDRRMSFWEAMELSRKLVSRNWWLILGLMLINGLVAASGILACCIGLFVTVPLAHLSMLFAYEDIFGQRANRPA